MGFVFQSFRFQSFNVSGFRVSGFNLKIRHGGQVLRFEYYPQITQISTEEFETFVFCLLSFVFGLNSIKKASDQLPLALFLLSYLLPSYLLPLTSYFLQKISLFFPKTLKCNIPMWPMSQVQLPHRCMRPI